MTDAAHHHQAIVVGVDGSSSSGPALAWAIEEASVRRLPIHLISAWSGDYPTQTLGQDLAAILERCHTILTAARHEVETVNPSLSVTTSASTDPAPQAIVEASHGADSVVVGSRGRRPLASALLGGTGLVVAARASCPVVVVHPAERDTPQLGPVVVGVDGSALSEDAVAYAFEHAAQRDVGLIVVHAWQPEYVAGVISSLSVEDGNTRLADEQQSLTAESIAGWREKFPDVNVRTRVVAGHPVEALARQSASAGLVVVGSHGRGPLGSALLGSVSQGVLRRAQCPVVIVRPQATAQRDLRWSAQLANH